MNQFGPQMRLEGRQVQTLVMTPALQQALKILQLSTAELQDQIAEEIENNETLEEESSPGEEAAAEVSQLERSLLADQSPQEMAFSLDAWKEYFGDSSSDLGDAETKQDKKSEFLQNAVARRLTLYEHLSRQLAFAAKTDEVRRLGEAILGNLDEDGYLRGVTLEEIAAQEGTGAVEVEQVLALVQGFDPAGVGARDLRECLLIQLRENPGEEEALCHRILQDHFKEVEHHNAPRIAEALGLPPAAIQKALERIARLEPRPGRPFAGGDTEYVVPDVLVEKSGEDYQVRLTQNGLPRLRISPYYLKLLKDAQSQGSKSVPEVKDYLRKKVQSAVWLVKSVEQRQKTLQRVAEALFRIQRDFLDHGVLRLRPLRLVDVAQEIGVHESTVARAVHGKYAQTPRGLYELKFFFTTGLASNDQEGVSSRAIQQRITDIIKGEDSRKPLSDSKIAELLKGEGVQVARRTVAKYREILKILPASQRKTF